MNIEQRITRLEDIEAIKQLKALYCEICDDGHDPERIVTIFTEDGIWEGKGIGIANGHGEIRALFERFRAMMSFTQHMTMNPRIEVTDTTAKGTWYFFGPFTFRDGNQAKWQATRYHEDYEKVDGEWKIKHLKIAPPGMSVDYEKGWGESRYN
ncbi:MAG: nuclear transport factor 2 family protein [Pseudomonadales bacterium]